MQSISVLLIISILLLVSLILFKKNQKNQKNQKEWLLSIWILLIVEILIVRIRWQLIPIVLVVASISIYTLLTFKKEKVLKTKLFIFLKSFFYSLA